MQRVGDGERWTKAWECLTFCFSCFFQSGHFSEDMIPTVGFNMRKVTKGNVTIKVSCQRNLSLCVFVRVGFVRARYCRSKVRRGLSIETFSKQLTETRSKKDVTKLDWSFF